MLKFETLAKFKSRRSGAIYLVKRDVKTQEVSCNCKGWIYRRRCKHLTYLEANNWVVEISDIPTYPESVRMDYGRNLEEKERWMQEHLVAVEL